MDDLEFEGDVEALENIPEIEEPVLEEIFKLNTDDLPLTKERKGSERLSKPVMAKLTKARLIAARAGQLQLGAPSVIPEGRLRSSELQEIAMQEFDERVLPLKIIRKFPDNTYEVWSLSDFKYFGRSTGRSNRSRQRKLKDESK